MQLWQQSSVCEVVVSLREAEVPLSYHDSVKRLFIKLHPREFKKAECLEGSIERLPLAQTANIMKSCIIITVPASVALHAAAGLLLPLEHKHAFAALRKQNATFKTTKAGTDYYDIVFHLFLFIHLNTAGCMTYENTTAEIMPTSVAKHTDCMAGCLANIIEPTVTIRMKALKKMAHL